MAKKITNDQSTEEGKRAVNQTAQYLANLLQQPVAGKKPQPINDEPTPEEIVEGLFTGRIKPGGFHTEDPTSSLFYNDTPFIIISGLMNGSQALRQRILEKIEKSMFNQFYGHIFEEVKKLVGSDDVTTNKLENIRDRIPGLWSAYRHYPLEGPMRAGVFHRWYQMILWQCDEKVVDQAIEIFTK